MNEFDFIFDVIDFICERQDNNHACRESISCPTTLCAHAWAEAAMWTKPCPSRLDGLHVLGYLRCSIPLGSTRHQPETRWTIAFWLVIHNRML